ncbi:hypothetical protein Q9966_002266 [Columba livia]|nr:hypothetical protein Q9966_002266 [Columba livia]
MNLLGLPQISLRKKDLYLGFMKKSAVLPYLNMLFALDIKSNFLMRSEKHVPKVLTTLRVAHEGMNTYDVGLGHRAKELSFKKDQKEGNLLDPSHLQQLEKEFSAEEIQSPGSWKPYAPLNDITVSTIGTVMQMYCILEKLLLQDKPLLFVAPTGLGKIAITNNFLRQLLHEKYVVCQINFSVQASANHTQDIFLTKLERRKKRVYSAPLGKRAFVFVDDLNMPAKEKYGAQPPIELLQQWIDHGYWFDRCNKY